MTQPAEDLDPIDLFVGGRIRELRSEQRITQARLAGALGVTFQQVQKYERGVNRMAASTLAKAANALGCDIADFFPKEGDVDDNDVGQVMQELQGLYEQMGRRQRAALLLNARALVFGRV